MKKILILALVVLVLVILAGNNAHAEEVKCGTYFEWEGVKYYDWTQMDWGLYSVREMEVNNKTIPVFEGIYYDAFIEGFYPDWTQATWLCVCYDNQFIDYDEFDDYSEFKAELAKINWEEVAIIYVEYGHFGE